MGTLKQLQTNFANGELDPLFRMRADTGAYANGAATLRNVALLNGGGITRRPGTENLYKLGAIDTNRTLPFEFSASERYILVLSDGTLDVFNLDGELLTTLTGCTWTTEQIRELTYTQVADVMIICHQSWIPQVVRRTGLSTFTVSDFAFETSVNGEKTYQPYYKFADDAIQIGSNGTSGSRTITATAAIFSPSYVGASIRWKDVEIEITAYTSPTVVTGTIKGTLQGTYDLDPFRTLTGSSIVEVTHVRHGFSTGQTVTISGANALGGFTSPQLNLSHTIYVKSDNLYTFAVSGAVATSSIDGGGPNVKYTSNVTNTRDWSEPVFSDVNGYPGAVAFHEGRLWFGGSPAQPDGVWGSRINRYFNFDTGTGLDDESVQVSIGSEDISNVKHMVSNRELQIFTATGEFYVPKLSNNQTITPSNVAVTRQTPFGCNDVTPLIFDGATLFVQASGKSIREYIYNDSAQAYTSTDITLLASHLIQNPIDMAVLYGTPERGEQYSILINQDGTAAVFHSARAEGLAGWVGWSMTNAEMHSACVIGNSIYVTVKRGDDYYLERFAGDDSLSLDGATSFTSETATTEWDVGLRYAGMTVDVVSSGMYLGSYDVDESGNISINSEVENITVGFSYEVTIKTLPISVQLTNGVLTGLPKRINRVILGLDSTLSVSVSGNTLILRGVRDDMSLSTESFTGVKEFFLLGYAREAQVTITQTEPLPLRLLGMAMEVAF